MAKLVEMFGQDDVYGHQVFELVIIQRAKVPTASQQRRHDYVNDALAGTRGGFGLIQKHRLLVRFRCSLRSSSVSGWQKMTQKCALWAWIMVDPDCKLGDLLHRPVDCGFVSFHLEDEGAQRPLASRHDWPRVHLGWFDFPDHADTEVPPKVESGGRGTVFFIVRLVCLGKTSQSIVSGVSAVESWE
ncbi:hypothetical protein VTI74DRAFT_5171 [Chaetomium olivicolor]